MSTTIDILPAGPNCWALDPKYTHGATYTLTYEPETEFGPTLPIRHLGYAVYKSSVLSHVLYTMACKLGVL